MYVGMSQAQPICKDITQIRVFVNPVLFNSLKIKSEGEKSLKTAPTFSFEVGVGLQQRLYKNLSVVADAGYMFHPYTFHFDFDVPSQIEGKSFDKESHKDRIYFFHAWLFPLSLKYETFLDKKVNYFVDIGIQFNVLLPKIEGMFTYTYLRDTSNADFNMCIEHIGKRCYTSGFIKFGLLFHTKKYHSFGVSLIAKYCPSDVYNGSYEFSNFSFADNKGKVSSKINYIGLELSCGITVYKQTMPLSP